VHRASACTFITAVKTRMITRAGLSAPTYVALLGMTHAIVAGQLGGAKGDDAVARTALPALQPSARPPTQPAPQGNPLWGISLERLSNTRERPIFSPSRRPPPPAVTNIAPLTRATQPMAVSEPPALSLVGTVVNEQESIGVFVDDTTKEALRLRPGEGRGGWVLRSVTRREARFDKNGETTTLALKKAGTEQGGSGTPQAGVQMANTRRRNARR
jgi:hypothetical protein